MIINLLRVKFVSLLLLVFRDLAQSVGILLYQYMAKLTYYLKPCKLFEIYFETKPNCRLLIFNIVNRSMMCFIVLGDKEKRLYAVFLLSGKRDSNPRPSAWEADALPAELLPQVLSILARRYNNYLFKGCYFGENFKKNVPMRCDVLLISAVAILNLLVRL